MSVSEFHNKKVSEVFLLKVLYIFSSPLAKLFMYYNIRADTITTLSNLSAILSYILIFYNFYLFMFFWILALVLDICDGIVARATNTSNAAGSFYDHFSDFLKIMGLFFFIGLYYDTKIVWVLVSLNFIAFATVDYLDGIIHKRSILIINSKVDTSLSNTSSKLSTKVILRLNRSINNLIVYRTFFIMHGQYNLILVPLAYNETVAKYIFVLSFLICLWTNILFIIHIKRQSDVMSHNNVSWK